MPAPSIEDRTPRQRDRQVNLRLSADRLALIDRAAGLLDLSRTDFLNLAAIAEAHRVLAEQTVLQLSAERYDELFDLLDAPARPIPSVAKTLDTQAPWE